MAKKTFDYLAKVKIENGYNVSVKFSVESVLSILLIEAREGLWCEEEVRKIYSNIKGIKWNTKLTSRFKAYMKHRQMYYYIFKKLCEYLKKDPNDVLNEGRCILVTTFSNNPLFDPYRIMPPKNNQKIKVIE